MSEFKIIETQEQFDEIVKDRIARAKESAVKEFADYEDIKKANGAYEKQIADLTEQLKKADEGKASIDDEIQALKEKVQQYEMASVKTKVAHEVGLPYELASKLSGDDEDSIREDAKTMAQFVKGQQSAPMGSNEPTKTDADPKQAAFIEMSKKLREE